VKGQCDATPPNVTVPSDPLLHHAVANTLAQVVALRRLVKDVCDDAALLALAERGTVGIVRSFDLVQLRRGGCIYKMCGIYASREGPSSHPSFSRDLPGRLRILPPLDLMTEYLPQQSLDSLAVMNVPTSIPKVACLGGIAFVECQFRMIYPRGYGLIDPRGYGLITSKQTDCWLLFTAYLQSGGVGATA
jgi:hypothetical protein